MLLTNTLTGEATLSLGKLNADGTHRVHRGAAADHQRGRQRGRVAVHRVGGRGADQRRRGGFQRRRQPRFCVSYASTNNLGIFLGHGDGTFTASSVALALARRKIAVGDFGGTAAPDIAVLSVGRPARGQRQRRTARCSSSRTTARRISPTLANPDDDPGLGTAHRGGADRRSGRHDLFVGLASGDDRRRCSAPGRRSTSGTHINAFNGVRGPRAVDDLDVLAPARRRRDAAGVQHEHQRRRPGLTTDVTPQVDVFSGRGDGTANGTADLPARRRLASTAHFVPGTDAIGVVAARPRSARTRPAAIRRAVSASAARRAERFRRLADNDGLRASWRSARRPTASSTRRRPQQRAPACRPSSLSTPRSSRGSFRSRRATAGTARHHDGGAGGGVKSLTYTPDARRRRASRRAALTRPSSPPATAARATAATGGNGGDIGQLTLSLNPGYHERSARTTRPRPSCAPGAAARARTAARAAASPRSRPTRCSAT